jgi:hypothetical protein
VAALSLYQRHQAPAIDWQSLSEGALESNIICAATELEVSKEIPYDQALQTILKTIPAEVVKRYQSTQGRPRPTAITAHPDGTAVVHFRKTGERPMTSLAEEIQKRVDANDMAGLERLFTEDRTGEAYACYRRQTSQHRAPAPHPEPRRGATPGPVLKRVQALAAPDGGTPTVEQMEQVFKRHPDLYRLYREEVTVNKRGSGPVSDSESELADLATALLTEAATRNKALTRSQAEVLVLDRHPALRQRLLAEAREDLG